MIDATITALVSLVGTRDVCLAVGRSRATHYRQHLRSPRPPSSPRSRPQAAKQPRALTELECAAVLEILRSTRFVDKAPAEIQAILLDEGTYLCSVTTMYRLLRAHGETGERRSQAEHPARVKPELIATGPNMMWSWDISKLKGPAKWSYFHL
jgi:putative transposase